MRLGALYAIFSLTGLMSFGQECPTITVPSNGDENVSVGTPIRWTPVEGIIGYVVSLGTTPGGEDVLNRRSSGLNNFYVPEVGLPENTRIYVTIRLFIFGEGVKVCPGEFFDTEDVTTPPVCTTLDRPVDGDTGVDPNRPIRWNYAETALGYRLSLGTSPGGRDLVDDLDVGNRLSYDAPDGLPSEGDIYVRITPYNENGDANSCAEESFSVGGESFDFCAPFYDSSQGGLVDRNPDIDFPDQVSICSDDLPTIITTDDEADGFRWFRISPDGSETFLGDGAEIALAETGSYRFEAYNIYVQGTDTIECASTRNFHVILSERPRIDAVEVTGSRDQRMVAVMVSGAGDYEYALDDPEGPYRDGNLFSNVSDALHIVYVRDKNGCGVAQETVEREPTVEDFPKFFTPNGDGINDYWQYLAPESVGEINIRFIRIFNRYGALIVQIDPNSLGWDGNFRGKPMPASDYWFKAISSSDQDIYGHFTLKR